MEDSADKSLSKAQVFSRRTFIKLGALAAGAALLRSDVPKTSELHLEPRVAVLDLFDVEAAMEKMAREKFAPGFSSRTEFEKMGIVDPDSISELVKGVLENDSQALLVMLQALSLKYKDHGVSVNGVLEKTAGFLNKDYSLATNKKSITDAVGQLAIKKDVFGNPSAYFSINQADLISKIQSIDESIVNMSFQPGEHQVTYTLMYGKDKNPELSEKLADIISFTINGKTTYTDRDGNNYTEDEYNELVKKAEEKIPALLDETDRRIEVMDGYAGEKTFENIKKLVEIAKRFPKKMFVAAGGNPTYLEGRTRIPDITAARKRLEEAGLWPDNLIVVGFTGYSGVGFGEGDSSKRQGSYGADFYVDSEDLKKLGLFAASSFATPVVTEIARQLVLKGIRTAHDIKNSLSEMSEIHNYYPKGSADKAQYKVLNLEKAKLFLSS